MNRIPLTRGQRIRMELAYRFDCIVDAFKRRTSDMVIATCFLVCFVYAFGVTLWVAYDILTS